MRSWVLLLFVLAVVVAIAHAQKTPKGGKRPNDKLEEKTKRDRDGQKVSDGGKRPNDRLDDKPKRDRQDRKKQIKKKDGKTKKGLKSKGEKHSKELKLKDTKHKKVLKSNDKKSKKKAEKAEKGLKSNDRKSKKKDKKAKKGLNSTGQKYKKMVEKTKKELPSKARKSKKISKSKNGSRKREKSENKSEERGREETSKKKKGGIKFEKKCPGTCVEDREECQGRLQGRNGCSGGDLCCVQGNSRQSGKDIKRFCSPLKPCNKLKGECRKKKTGCKSNEEMYKNNKKKTYCTKKSCICCVVNNCSEKKKCSNLGGSCQSKKTLCDGTFLKEKKYCKGKKCGCCVPDTPCPTKKKCSKLGGSCQSKKEPCDGTLLKEKKYCKNRKCGCCVPDTQCKPKETCTLAGGTCQLSTENCNGTLKSKDDNGEKYCKGKDCRCCIPDENATDNHEWGYTGENGPSSWADYFFLCGGSSQSPINIDTSTAVGDIPWEPLTFDNYDQIPTSMTMLNNGHSAQVSMEINSVVGVEGGHMTGHYTFLQFHFHWGSENTRGSEHTIDGVRYPAEVHLVHYKTEYGSIENAIMNSDGVAVLGIMLEINEEVNGNLTSVITGLQSIQSYGNFSSISPFPLQNLLPGNLMEFYQYQGSLTTPTCNEIVTWTVFKNPISISDSQLAKFRDLTDGFGLPLVNNYRPVQELNNRTVYKGL